MKQLYVFGSPKASCKNCRKAEAVIEEIIAGREQEFEYRRLTLDSSEAAELGVMMTPAVVLNGEILVLGELPRKEDLKDAILA